MFKQTKTKFCDLGENNLFAALDCFFAKQEWQLVFIENEDYDSSGYQVFFGNGIKVDNLFEYAFPCLLDKDCLIEWAQNFYESHMDLH